jgi:glycerol-3-phosphate acyltransferase PlsX
VADSIEGGLIALDAMGGDFAPKEIVLGAKKALADYSIRSLLVGDKTKISEFNDVSLPVYHASEVISMDDDPAKSVRNKKDSSLSRCADLVSQGKCTATISAGNTGAAMAAALFKIGRIKGVSRPAIATTIPMVGHHPTVMLDSGANAECQSDWLVQFAQMGAVYSSIRYNIEKPKVALLSIGEESTKGSPLIKETHKKLVDLSSNSFEFIGNVEGRDLLEAVADVVVTDGFTGNVALKTLEGSLKFFMKMLLGVMNTNDETKKAQDVLLNYLLPIAEELDPETTGGAMLLGIDGISIISHGSSSAKAISNALRVGDELVKANIVEHLKKAVEQN